MYNYIHNKTFKEFLQVYKYKWRKDSWIQPNTRSIHFPIDRKCVGLQMPSRWKVWTSHLMLVIVYIICVRNPSKSLDIWRHLNQVYGSLVRLDIPGREPTVLVFDPHVAEQVQMTNWSYLCLSVNVSCKVYRNEGVYPHRPAFFSMRAAKREEAECPATYGLLSNNGEDWKTFRKTVQVKER